MTFWRRKKKILDAIKSRPDKNDADRAKEDLVEAIKSTEKSESNLACKNDTLDNLLNDLLAG